MMHHMVINYGNEDWGTPGFEAQGLFKNHNHSLNRTYIEVILDTSPGLIAPEAWQWLLQSVRKKYRSKSTCP